MGRILTHLSTERERENVEDETEKENMNVSRSMRGRSCGVAVRATPTVRVARVSRRVLRLRSKATDMSEQLEDAIKEARTRARTTQRRLTVLLLGITSRRSLPKSLTRSSRDLKILSRT